LASKIEAYTKRLELNRTATNPDSAALWEGNSPPAGSLLFALWMPSGSARQEFQNVFFGCSLETCSKIDTGREQEDIQEIARCDCSQAARVLLRLGGLNCSVKTVPIVFVAPVLKMLMPNWLQLGL